MRLFLQTARQANIVPTITALEKSTRVIAACLNLLPAVACGQDAGQDEALEGLLSRIEAVELRLERDLAVEDSAQADLREAETGIMQLREAAREAQKQLAGRREEQERLAAALQRSAEAHRRSRQALSGAIRRAWRGGRQGQIKAFLGGASAGEINRRLAWAGILVRSWTEGAREALRVAANVRELRSESGVVEEQMAALRALQAGKLRELERATALRQAALAALGRSDDGAGAGSDPLDARGGTLASLAEDLGQIVQEHPSAPLPSVMAARGQLQWPLAGRVLRKFGAGPGGGQANWDGILLEAEEGAEVRAPHPGRVVFADWVRGLGFLMVLDHGENVLSLYAYNDRLLAEKGETVSKGQVIARAGSTGGRPEAGLYFAIRQNGRPVDPAPWLSR